MKTVTEGKEVKVVRRTYTVTAFYQCGDDDLVWLEDYNIIRALRERHPKSNIMYHVVDNGIEELKL